MHFFCYRADIWPPHLLTRGFNINFISLLHAASLSSSGIRCQLNLCIKFQNTSIYIYLAFDRTPSILLHTCTHVRFQHPLEKEVICLFLILDNLPMYMSLKFSFLKNLT